MYKPEFFDVMKKTREAEDSLTDVWVWFQNLESARHSRTEIALEMGNVLKLRLRPGSGKANANKGGACPRSQMACSSRLILDNLLIGWP